MKNENGQALVEAALSLPFIVVMLLGMTEIGKMVYCAIEVTNSARAAAQYATMNGGAFSTNSSGMDVTGMLTAAQSDSGTWEPLYHSPPLPPIPVLAQTEVPLTAAIRGVLFLGVLRITLDHHCHGPHPRDLYT